MESRLIASSDNRGVSVLWLCAHARNLRIHSSGGNSLTTGTGGGCRDSKTSRTSSSSGTPLACASARYACSTCAGRLSVTVISSLLHLQGNSTVVLKAMERRGLASLHSLEHYSRVTL